MNWRVDRYPSNTTSPEWRARRGRGPVKVGRPAVDDAVAKWQLIIPLLLSPPGTAYFFPVLGLDAYKHKAYGNARRQLRFVLMAVMAMAVVLTGVAFFSVRSNAFFTVVLVLLLVAFYLLLDYWFVFRSPDCVADRAMYITWLHMNCRLDLAFWVGLMVLAGAGQLLLQTFYGGMESAMIRWGMVYDVVRLGEWWRAFVGPFFHSGVPHWIINTAMLALIGTAISGLSRASAVSVFLLGNAFGALAALFSARFGFSTADGYVGVSDGVFALVGWGVAVSWRQPRRVPCNFGFTLTAFFVVVAFVGWLTMPEASTAAHVAGFLFGIVWGLLLPGWNRFR